jgi:putative nucleotidyltransferase with HDIG domain
MLINTSLSFKSKVGRRIFILFIATAMVPITALAVLSFTHVVKQLNHQSQRRLHQASKGLGMALVERLSFLEAELDLIVSGNRARPGISTIMEIDRRSDRLAKRFRAIALVKGKVAEVVFGDTLLTFDLQEAERKHLGTGRAAILERSGQRPRPRIYMVKAVDPDNLKQGVLWAEMNTPYLWGIAESDTLPNMAELSVLGSLNNVIYTSIPLSPSILERLEAELIHSSVGKLEWRNAQEEYLASYWSTFLKYAYFAPKWTVVLSISKSDVFLPVTNFRKTFLLVLAIAILTVLLLSSIQIRRSLVPLEKLRKGTSSIAKRDFDQKVILKTGDEFEELAKSFNNMGATLNAQFNALKTMAEIDRAVLSSLDAERIVDALLKQVGDLFSYGFCAITLVDADGERNVRTYVRGQTPDAVELTEVDRFTEHDLKVLRENPEWFVIDSADGHPDYLAKLTIRDIKSFLVLPIFLKKVLAGIITFGTRALSHFTHDDIVRARQIADQVAVALTNAHLLEELEELNLGTLTALARAVDAKSPWTAGHSERVTEIALKIGERLGLPEEGLERLHRGGLLHDIGKIGVPASILDKPGKLSDEEYDVIREHTTIGARILEPIRVYADIVAIVRQHHERLDGDGYPDGLSGEEINLEARILAVADVYDALISDRPYRPGMRRGDAIQLIKQETGLHFDRNVVDAFLAVVEIDEEDARQSDSQTDFADIDMWEFIGHGSRRIRP